MTSESYIRLRDAVLSYPSSPYNRLTLKEEVFRILHLSGRSKMLLDVTALNGVSLDINEGEKVAIIGRNGAGKSTLLKAIAGIFPLQSGRIETHGRVRSMFELSVGFEPDATGRENIMYRGLLLGETPNGIREKEQAIVEFADLGDFIDYPLKTYSAGMMVRLAFAISTSISGDILLLDEILGAGDAVFQEKAKRRMQELIDQAKIIVLVSHDMNAVRRICTRAIYLKGGKLVADGDVEAVIKEYLS